MQHNQNYVVDVYIFLLLTEILYHLKSQLSII